ncbi:Ion channel protein, partial [Streptomyces anulatus]
MGPGDAVDGRVFHVKLPGHDAMARRADELVVPTRVMLPRRVGERAARPGGP